MDEEKKSETQIKIEKMLKKAEAILQADKNKRGAKHGRQTEKEAQ